MAEFKMLWLDMEMTGLDVDKEVPIEVAAIVTDARFAELGQYHAVIKQPQKYLDAMDEWNRNQHSKSGLVAQIPGGRDPDVVETDLCAFIKTHFGAERAVLCGNSIFQDRLFIRKYLPRVEALLHYRMIDVTAWKVVFNNLYGQKFPKKDGHRAVDDIRESLSELKFYLSHVRVPN